MNETNRNVNAYDEDSYTKNQSTIESYSAERFCSILIDTDAVVWPVCIIKPVRIVSSLIYVYIWSAWTRNAVKLHSSAHITSQTTRERETERQRCISTLDCPRVVYACLTVFV